MNLHANVIRAVILTHSSQMGGVQPEMDQLYGENLVNHYRIGAFGVHKDLQGLGIGRYIHEHNVQKVGVDALELCKS